jgi:hypothetical protein
LASHPARKSKSEASSGSQLAAFKSPINKAIPEFDLYQGYLKSVFFRPGNGRAMGLTKIHLSDMLMMGYVYILRIPKNGQIAAKAIS